MQERGSNRLSVRRDEEMKHELQGMLRSDHPTRAEEWHDPEPTAEDDPPLAGGPVPPRGSTSVEEAENEAFRFELARYLRRSVWPADREKLLSTLRETQAPDEVVDPVGDLPPDRTFANVQEVVAVLGRKPSA